MTAAGLHSDGPWPPPPHDPRERVPFQVFGDWEARQFDPGSSKHEYFASRGMLHVQLWHRARRISLLTPSRITAERFEVFPVKRWKCAVGGYAALVEVMIEEFGIVPPKRSVLAGLERWFVDRAAREAGVGESPLIAGVYRGALESSRDALPPATEARLSLHLPVQ